MELPSPSFKESRCVLPFNKLALHADAQIPTLPCRWPARGAFQNRCQPRCESHLRYPAMVSLSVFVWQRQHLGLSGLTDVPEVRGKQKRLGNCSVFVSLNSASVRGHQSEPWAELQSEPDLFLSSSPAVASSYTLSLSNHSPPPPCRLCLGRLVIASG